jgi:hypothetical protein
VPLPAGGPSAGRGRTPVLHQLVFQGKPERSVVLEIHFAVAGFLLALVLLVTITSLVQGALKGREEFARFASGQRGYKRSTLMLWVLILLAIAYAGLLCLLDSPTGIRLLDGSIGVALGLHICAHPAANMVNMLFFEWSTPRQSSSGTAILQWLALN